MSLAALLLAGAAAASAGDFLAKYSPENKPSAIPMKRDPGYLRAAPAPDFWALIPYYEGMRGGHSASAATMAMVLNALRQDTRYSAADELVTEASLLKKVTTHAWAAKVSDEKPTGVKLAELGEIADASLAVYGSSAVARVIPVLAPGRATRAAVRARLEENERSGRDFLIAHYMQSVFTGDPEGAVGVYAAVGAFDAGRDRVLILETDRKYYEPYWVSLDAFVDALAALKGGGGLLWIK